MNTDPLIVHFLNSLDSDDFMRFAKHIAKHYSATLHWERPNGRGASVVTGVEFPTPIPMSTIEAEMREYNEAAYQTAKTKMPADITITVEGPVACGKSAVLSLIRNALRENSFDVRVSNDDDADGDVSDIEGKLPSVLLRESVTPKVPKEVPLLGPKLRPFVAPTLPTPGGRYPDDNPKTAIGASKIPLDLVPPIAMQYLALAFKDGAPKYGPHNWRDQKVSSTVYYAAALRHLFAWVDGQDNAEDSGVHHLAHVMACCAILLDAQSVGMLNDNRPTAGAAAGMQKEFNA